MKADWGDVNPNGRKPQDFITELWLTNDYFKTMVEAADHNMDMVLDHQSALEWWIAQEED